MRDRMCVQAPDGSQIPDDATPDEAAAAMAEQPAFMERPVFEIGGRAVVGRPPSNVIELLEESLDDAMEDVGVPSPGAGGATGRYPTGSRSVCTSAKHHAHFSLGPWQSQQAPPSGEQELEPGSVLAWVVYRIDIYGHQAR